MRTFLATLLALALAAPAYATPCDSATTILPDHTYTIAKPSGTSSYSCLNESGTDCTNAVCSAIFTNSTSVALKLTSPIDGTVTIDTCSSNTTFDTVLWTLFADCNNSPTRACVDNTRSCPPIGTTGKATGSSLTIDVVAGKPLYIMLSGKDGVAGTATVHVSKIAKRAVNPTCNACITHSDELNYKCNKNGRTADNGGDHFVMDVCEEDSYCCSPVGLWDSTCRDEYITAGGTKADGTPCTTSTTTTSTTTTSTTSTTTSTTTTTTSTTTTTTAP